MTVASDNSRITEGSVPDQISPEMVATFFRSGIQSLMDIMSERGIITTTVTAFNVNVTEWEDAELKSFQPIRVQVFSGDQKEDWGTGMYVGDVNVFVYLMPDGSLRSWQDAENEPDPAQAPEGGVLRRVGRNPKIVLDQARPDGRTVVYGCQVWWREVEEPKEAANVAQTA